SASGATVNLTGTLNNVGTTLTLSPGLGAWRLSGGTINGGTITSTNGSTLALSDANSTLAGVTIASGTTVDGTQNIGGSDAYTYVTGGLTLNGLLNLGSASGSTNRQLWFENGAQALSGTGTVTFGSSTGNALDAYGSSTVATLTLAGGITVQGGSGNVKGYFSADSVINEGGITIPSGQTFTLGGTKHGTITATGTTLTLGGTNWVNNGTIAATGATVNLGGSF